MRVATIDIVIQTIFELYPVTFTQSQIPAFTEQYRGVLSGLDPDELNDAWHHCMTGWKKKTGPSASDILDAHRTVQVLRGKKAASAGGSLKDKLDKRDAERTEDRRNLIERYQADHA